MDTSRNSESVNRLYRDLGFQPLSHWWGRAEMFIGLLSMGASVLLMIYLAAEAIHTTARKELLAGELLSLPALASVILFALGGYLTLVGHRRHLYESNDRLTAYLADLMRSGAVNTSTAHPAVTPTVPATGNGMPLTPAQL